jgi:peroxiredoxin Q/BCP
MMRSFATLRWSLLLGAVAASTSVAAQQPAAQQPAAPPQPEVGQQAPDFTIAGATRYGLLRDSIHLADFRGQTVIIAFFPKARTKG